MAHHPPSPTEYRVSSGCIYGPSKNPQTTYPPPEFFTGRGGAGFELAGPAGTRPGRRLTDRTYNEIDTLSEICLIKPRPNQLWHADWWSRTYFAEGANIATGAVGLFCWWSPPRPHPVPNLAYSPDMTPFRSTNI